MHIAHLMVLIAAALPYITVGGYDNAKPRDSLAALHGWRARANWAHLNGFEAFPAFAAAVILAELAHASQARVDQLACAFVAFRIAYIGCYLLDAATVRSLVWGLGFACTVWLFVLAI
jgi:uncharacterized MAPEG superfamily protein